MRRRTGLVALAGASLAALYALVGCTAAGTGTAEPHAAAALALPPAGGAPDYQLGGAYDPSPAVEIVVRDRTADAAEGRYSICYVNAFQTQPDELGEWPDELLLRDAAGEPVRDAGWPDEVLVDTSTSANRDAIAEIAEPWITGCAASGFNAVEFDNLDSASRSDGALTDADNRALATALVRAAHAAGLAAAQKNAAELSAALHDEAGFDFAIAEECAAFDECDAYASVYGDHVIDVEYFGTSSQLFADACADPDTPASVVLRDRELSTPDDPGFVFALCPSSN